MPLYAKFVMSGSSIHHEGTKDTKMIVVGSAQRRRP
jgi:hypothetical protein